MITLQTHETRAGKVESRTLFEQGNALYQKGLYDSAAICYSAILSRGEESDAIYYNLGNSYFRMKDYPHAILNYHRALKLNPKNSDAAFNLELSRTYTIDKFSPSNQWRLTQWLGDLYQLFTPRAWALFSYLFFSLLLGCLLLVFFTRKPTVWKASLAGSFLTLALFIGAVWGGMVAQRKRLNPSEAVIMQSVVSVKGAPNSSAKDLFLLHSGSTVQVLEREDEWIEIRILDGHQGWVEKSTITEI